MHASPADPHSESYVPRLHNEFESQQPDGHVVGLHAESHLPVATLQLLHFGVAALSSCCGGGSGRQSTHFAPASPHIKPEALGSM
jgi:hypothetical protein